MVLGGQLRQRHLQMYKDVGGEFRKQGVVKAFTQWQYQHGLRSTTGHKYLECAISESCDGEAILKPGARTNQGTIANGQLLQFGLPTSVTVADSFLITSLSPSRDSGLSTSKQISIRHTAKTFSLFVQLVRQQTNCLPAA